MSLDPRGKLVAPRDVLERLGVARADLATPPDVALVALVRALHLLAQPLLWAVLVAVAVLSGDATWWLVPVVGARAALFVDEVRTGRVALLGAVRPGRREALVLLLFGLLLLAAGGSDIELVAVGGLLPLLGGASAPPRRIVALGLVLLGLVVLATLPDLLGDDPPRISDAVGAPAAFLLLTTVGGALLARARLALSARVAQADAGRRALLAEGLGLDARERHGATAQLRATTLVRLRDALGRIRSTPADLVGARADVTAAVAALRTVVTDLHPAARRSRELPERLRASLERRLGHAPTADVAARDLTPADEELLLAVVRDVGDVARTSGAGAGVHLLVEPRAERTAILVDLPVPVAAVAPHLQVLRETAARVGARVRLTAGGAGSCVRVDVPVLAAASHLTGDLLPPRTLALSIALSRAAFLALLVPFAVTVHALDAPAAPWVALAAAAWMLAGIAVAGSPAWRRYPITWPSSVLDIAWLAAGIAVSGPAPRELGHLLPTLPLLYLWLFERRDLRRLEIAIVVGGLGALAAPGLAGEGVSASHTARVAMALAFSFALAELIAAGRARLQQRLVALEDEHRDLLASALRDADAERRRLAFALHDGPLQTLLSVRQDLEEALIAPSADAPARVAALLDRAERELRAALEDDEAPAAPASLPDALRAILARAAARGGLRTQLHVAAHAEGGADASVVALARELVTNVVRHAQATQVDVRVRREGPAVVLEVRDDGRGIEPGRPADAIAAGHVGLASCASVTEEAGGTLELDAVPGSGTTVRASLPAAPAAATAR